MMKIKLKHKDRQFVQDVVKHFKLKQLSTIIPNKSMNLKVKDLVELSKSAPNNMNHFSCKNISGDDVYVVAFMGSSIIFNETNNTVVLRGDKHVLFMVPQISLYLKPLLLTKEFVDIISTNEENTAAPWYQLEAKSIEGNQFLSSKCPQCEAPVTMFQTKKNMEKTSQVSKKFDGPEFARQWLSEIPEACDECGTATDDDTENNQAADNCKCIINCNRCGYSSY